MRPEHVPEGGLSEQPRGAVGVCDVLDGHDRVEDVEVDHSIHVDRHTVLGEYLEGGRVESEWYRKGAAVKNHTLCGGTSKVFVRRSTATNLSMHGRMKKIPAVGEEHQ